MQTEPEPKDTPEQLTGLTLNVATRKNRYHANYDLGIQDERGRAIGYIAVITDSKLEEVKLSKFWNPVNKDRWPGKKAGDTVHTAVVQVTRNGKPYGATQPFYQTADVAEAWDYIASQGLALTRRYEKKFNTKANRVEVKRIGGKAKAETETQSEEVQP